MLILCQSSREPFGKRRAGIRQIFEQCQTFLCFGRKVSQFYGVIQRRADGSKSREQTVRGKAGAKKPTEDKRDDQEANQQREGLVSNVVFGIGRKQHGYDRRADNSQSDCREASPCPVTKGGSGAVEAINEEPEEGHGKKVRISKFEVRNKSEAQDSTEI